MIEKIGANEKSEIVIPLRDDIFDEPDLTGVDFYKELKKANLGSITPEQSHYMHSIFVLERTNTIRDLIENNMLEDIDARHKFYLISKLHIGANPIEHILAIYDPTIILEQGYKASLGNTAVDLDITKPTYSGFELEQLRKVQVEMYRSYNQSVIGVPLGTLPECFNLVMDFADNTLANVTEDNCETKWENLVAVSFLLDLIHPKIDCNGRISEDWFIAMQHDLVKKQPLAVKLARAWSHNGLRAKDVKKLVDTETQESDLVLERDKNISARQNAAVEIRQWFFNEIKSKISKDKILELGVNTEAWNAYLRQHPELFISTMKEIILGLGKQDAKYLSVFSSYIKALKETPPYKGFTYISKDVLEEPNL